LRRTRASVKKLDPSADSPSSRVRGYCIACCPGCGPCTRPGNAQLIPVSSDQLRVLLDRRLAGRDRDKHTCLRGWTPCVPCIVNTHPFPRRLHRNIDGMRPEWFFVCNPLCKARRYIVINMAEAAAPRHGDESPSNVEIDPDFEPQKRPRSCTWPLPRPESGADKPGTNDTDVIPEEEDDEHEGGDAQKAGDDDDGGCATSRVSSSGSSRAVSQPVEVQRGPCKEEAADGSPSSAQTPAAALGGSASQQLRKSSSRRNAWGNYSYADLITQAIESSPENRLTLSQIYDWMVRSVPYFKDKGDSNSSAGWKVSGDTLGADIITKTSLWSAPHTPMVIVEGAGGVPTQVYVNTGLCAKQGMRSGFIIRYVKRAAGKWANDPCGLSTCRAPVVMVWVHQMTHTFWFCASNQIWARAHTHTHTPQRGSGSESWISLWDTLQQLLTSSSGAELLFDFKD